MSFDCFGVLDFFKYLMEDMNVLEKCIECTCLYILYIILEGL